MRGITCTILIASLFTCKSELGESSETILFSITSVGVLASWDCRWLHMSNTPVSLVIRTTSPISMLTSTYCLHPCGSTLIIMWEHNGMVLFDWQQLSHWLIQDFTTGTARKHYVNWWCWNHNWNISRSLWSWLLDRRCNICIIIRCML